MVGPGTISALEALLPWNLKPILKTGGVGQR